MPHISDLRNHRLNKLPRDEGKTVCGGIFEIDNPDFSGPDGGPLLAATWAEAESGAMSEPRFIEDGEESMKAALESLTDFLADPERMGYLPGRIEVIDPAMADYLADRLDNLPVTVSLADEELRELFGSLAETLGAIDYSQPADAFYDRLDAVFDEFEDGPSMMDGQDVELKDIKYFANAAKRFDKARPWRLFNDMDPIEIVDPAPPDPALQIAVLMGSGGQEFGLAFFRTLDHYWTTFRSDRPEELFSLGPLWSLNLNHPIDVPPGDLRLWAENNLARCFEGRIPVLTGFTRDNNILMPSGEMLRFVAGLMKALAETAEREADTGQWSVDIRHPRKKATYSFRLPLLNEPPSPDTLRQCGLWDPRADRTDDRRQDDPALDEARDLCYEAFGAVGRRRIRLARRALERSEDCPDAWVILAERALDFDEKLALYEKGVDAGRRAIGEQTFERPEALENHPQVFPYLRALNGAAYAREAIGYPDEAVDLYAEMVNLDPDNTYDQLNRLVELLLRLERIDEAAQLVERFPKTTDPLWAFLAALTTYLHEGDTKPARQRLQAAHALNPYVYIFISGAAPPEAKTPQERQWYRETVEIGQAVMEAYDQDPRALHWACKVLAPDKGKKKGKGKPKGPRR